MQPLFIIFIDTNISINLINLILHGKIHGYIYTNKQIILQLKKNFFSKKTKSNFKFFEYNMPFNLDIFSIILTSNSFWDNIPSDYTNLYVLYNPQGLHLNIKLKKTYEKPFFFIPMIKYNFSKMLIEDPYFIDEQISKGFIFYINNKFAKKTIQRFTKKNILDIRNKCNMQHNEHIIRQHITPFYHYFIHNMINLGYNI